MKLLSKHLQESNKENELFVCKTKSGNKKAFLLSLVATFVVLITAPDCYGQLVPFDRLPSEQFDVKPPSTRVSGKPGEMRILASACRTLPTAETRRRIVNVAVQEWGFFGFPIVDQTIETKEPSSSLRRRRFRGGNPEESARVASTIGGYWAASSDGSWIVDRQNESWNGSRGLSSRWRTPWSAAFISWVMCEGGLGKSSQFQRAIAHHAYIDQAIRARDGHAPSAAFVAYDAGETVVESGDLLCSARRPGYRSIAERRRQLGQGARTHCDVVVKVDNANQRILTVGGNVQGRVSLKILPLVREGDVLIPVSQTGHRMFAHLKLQAEAIEAEAFDNSPTMKALEHSVGIRAPNHVKAMNLLSTLQASD